MPLVDLKRDELKATLEWVESVVFGPRDRDLVDPSWREFEAKLRMALEQEGEPDWPEVTLARELVGNRPLIDSTGRKPPGWKRIETCRYVPASPKETPSS